ncbi:carbohydrate kinase family protein, partial [Mycobacterium sp. NAZ190054]|uniref:carbohydrate kinase family protein n=1 Tax=Mycobacterium sp. NAZ190054 TaxID=1747766 RepID=UPI00079497BC
MSSQRVFFVGDVGIDTTVLLPAVPAPDEKMVADELHEATGGVVANAAVAAARTGADVTLFTAAGDDIFGRSIPARLADEGIDVHVEWSAKATCRAIILVDGGGEKRLVLAPDVAMYPGIDTVDALNLDAAAWLHTAAYDRPASARLIERCRAAGVPVSIDLEPATMPGGLPDLSAHLAGCHTVFLNERAAAAIGPDAVDRILDLGAREVVETLGPRGVRLHHDGASVAITPPRIDAPVVDTTGAGDALAGWHAVRRAAGDGAAAALRL